MKNKFVIILKDKQKGSLTNELLEQHITHLRKLLKQGKLVICGPFKNDDAAIQILVAENEVEAHTLIKSDPFIKYKYYKSYDIFELIEANENNNWLMDNPQTKNNIK